MMGVPSFRVRLIAFAQNEYDRPKGSQGPTRGRPDRPNVRQDWSPFDRGFVRHAAPGTSFCAGTPFAKRPPVVRPVTTGGPTMLRCASMMVAWGFLVLVLAA